MNALSRRRFLKISAATFGAGAAATQIPPLTHLAHAAAPTGGQVKTVPTFCEMCFWRCGGIASRPRRQAVEVRGQSARPAVPRPAVPARHRRASAPSRPGPPAHPADPDRRTRQGRVEDRRLGGGARRHPRPLREIKDAHGAGSIALFSHGHGGGFFKTLLAGLGSKVVVAPSYDQCRGPRQEGLRADLRRGRGLPGDARRAVLAAAWRSSARTSARTCTTPPSRTSPRRPRRARS